MMSGGFVLHNETNNIKSYFKEGKEIVTYRDADDLLRRISYFLEHEKERKAIAKAGRERVMKDYTFKHSISRILDCMEGDGRV